MEKNTLLMGITGTNKIVQQDRSAAIKTVEDVICVMTLNKSQRGALTIENNAKINAPGCSIQVNSSNRQALMSNGNYKPEAKKICVHGGAVGNLGPNLQADCTAVDDPYSHIRAPNIVGNEACDYGPISFFDFSSYTDVIDVGERDSTRSPGVYCNGLHIYDSEVEFLPGTYIIHNGPFSIGKGSKVYGEDVTFIFSGDDSYLYTYDNFSMDFKAPSTGPYAGLLFFQDPNANQGGTSILKGSADIRIVGTAYFPTQELFVGGLGTMGANSPALAFIADTMTFTSDIDKIVSEQERDFQVYKTALETIVSFAGMGGITASSENTPYMVGSSNGQEDISTNVKGTDFTTSILTTLGSHSSAGLPPILPRSDSGARLISVDKNEPLTPSAQ